jgi:hypothetical protein
MHRRALVREACQRYQLDVAWRLAHDSIGALLIRDWAEKEMNEKVFEN